MCVYDVKCMLVVYVGFERLLLCLCWLFVLVVSVGGLRLLFMCVVYVLLLAVASCWCVMLVVYLMFVCEFVLVVYVGC